MEMLNRCPSTLAEGYDTYSPKALKNLFDTKKISHILPYHPIAQDEADAEKFMANRKRISISGVQNKYSLTLKEHNMVLTEEGERGRYLLKPKPGDLRLSHEIPANEHLTMQIAAQVFGIEIAANGLCFFLNGEPAYVTRRFDVRTDGFKLRKEDFATLAGVTSDSASSELKYHSSYQEVAELLKRFAPAWRIELVRFFRLVVFNFLFSNGDAHLKNFSLLETPDGDFRLSPAYDLLNTHIHVNDTDFALDKGLFREEHPEHFKMGTKANGATFQAFGLAIGLPEKVIMKELANFSDNRESVERLVRASFLSDNVQRTYLSHYREKRNRLSDFKI